MKTTTETFRFKKGEKTHLDLIYDIQGLSNGDWWEAPDPLEMALDEEDVTILEDIIIKVTVTR